MNQTRFIKGDTVICVLEKRSLFHYLGGRPVLAFGQFYRITDCCERDGVEFYRVGGNVNWYQSTHFDLTHREE